MARLIFNVLNDLFQQLMFCLRRKSLISVHKFNAKVFRCNITQTGHVARKEPYTSNMNSSKNKLDNFTKFSQTLISFKSSALSQSTCKFEDKMSKIYWERSIDCVLHTKLNSMQWIKEAIGKKIYR